MHTRSMVAASPVGDHSPGFLQKARGTLYVPRAVRTCSASRSPGAIPMHATSVDLRVGAPGVGLLPEIGQHFRKALATVRRVGDRVSVAVGAPGATITGAAETGEVVVE